MGGWSLVNFAQPDRKPVHLQHQSHGCIGLVEEFDAGRDASAKARLLFKSVNTPHVELLSLRKMQTSFHQLILILSRGIFVLISSGRFGPPTDDMDEILCRVQRSVHRTCAANGKLALLTRFPIWFVYIDIFWLFSNSLDGRIHHALFLKTSLYRFSSPSQGWDCHPSPTWPLQIFVLTKGTLRWEPGSRLATLGCWCGGWHVRPRSSQMPTKMSLSPTKKIFIWVTLLSTSNDEPHKKQVTTSCFKNCINHASS